VASNETKADFVEKVVNLAVQEGRKFQPGVMFEVRIPASLIPKGLSFTDIRGAVEAKASRSKLVTMGSDNWTYRFFRQE